MVEILGPRARARVAGRLPVLLLFSASPVLAQSFDCSKASPPIETVICASTALRAQDNALDGAYARAQYVLRDDAAASPRIRQLSVAEIMAETIRRISNDDSVSSLFID